MLVCGEENVVNVCLCVQVCGDGSAVSKSKAARIKEPLFKLGHPLQTMVPTLTIIIQEESIAGSDAC